MHTATAVQSIADNFEQIGEVSQETDITRRIVIIDGSAYLSQTFDSPTKTLPHQPTRNISLHEARELMIDWDYTVDVIKQRTRLIVH